jgi:hypothetical protein
MLREFLSFLLDFLIILRPHLSELLIAFCAWMTYRIRRRLDKAHERDERGAHLHKRHDDPPPPSEEERALADSTNEAPEDGAKNVVLPINFKKMLRRS